MTEDTREERRRTLQNTEERKENEDDAMTTMTSASPTTISTAPLLQTTLRQTITPYLPPPLIVAMRQLDSQLEPYVGPEGSMNILGSILVAWLLYHVVRLLGKSTCWGGGRAIQQDVHNHDILPSNAMTRHFDGTILLCGPSMAGKTTIFYHLVYGKTLTGNNTANSNMKTVKSIKSNTGFLDITSSNKNDSDGIEQTWRVLDTPGHWGPEKLFQAIRPSQVQRIVLVIDSTQPAASAADYLYALVTTNKSGIIDVTSPQKVLISCHKSKHPKAKNARRIKLQLRSELERLSKLRGDDDGTSTSGSTMDWEQILNSIPMCSSNVAVGKSTDATVMDVVQNFCDSGT